MLRRCAFVLAVLLAARIALAADAYYSVPLSKANLNAQVPAARPVYRAGLMEAMFPYIRLDGPGDAYYAPAADATLPPPVLDLTRGAPLDARICARAEAGKDLTGTLFVPKADYDGMLGIGFRIPASAALPGDQTAFLRAKAAHYQRFIDRDLPGGAWFRFQRDQALAALGQALPDDRNARLGRLTSDLDDTFGLLSGDRALSENLQLDRALRIAPGAEATVKLDSIKGIDIREMDWKPLVKDLKPQLDPLASIIPADQHAIFFPSFTAAASMADEADRDGTPVLDLVQSRAEDARVKERYQQQLGLSLTGLGRLLGPQFINSVAITGSDPYWRLGSDVAVLFEPRNDPAAVSAMLTAQVEIAARGRDDVKRVQGDVPFAYHGLVSPDRSVCSYTAQIGNAIVVSNSLRQIERLVLTSKGQAPSLAAQPEYIYFRDRYKRGDAEETALLMLSDATIRRWCGPRCRIADSRRTRALAAMSAEQARNLDALVKGGLIPVSFQSTLLDIGPLQLTSAGVSSPIYGSMQFMTPIIELEFDAATKEEASAYERWRDTYQQNWNQYFDPIAIRFTAAPQKLAADVSVMPLIANTDYAQIIDLTRGAKISDIASDRHDALASFAISLNKNARLMQQIGNLGNVLGSTVKIDILSWIGQTASVYVDDDPYWQELPKAKDPGRSIDKHLANLPLAVRLEVTSPLKFTLFMAALRAFIEGSAPGLTTWEVLKYNDQPYVKISQTEKGQHQTDLPAELAIYYAAMSDALVISLNENVIKHALDRDQARAQHKSTLPDTHPWLGSNLCFQAEPKLLESTAALLLSGYQNQMQFRAWSNIPILNEWKRRYPDRDPVQLQEAFWQMRPTCPGGGHYVWNARFQTMESTVYGHPAEPRTGPATPSLLNDLLFANFGLDFAAGGLRARAIIDRQPR